MAESCLADWAACPAFVRYLAALQLYAAEAFALCGPMPAQPQPTE